MAKRLPHLEFACADHSKEVWFVRHKFRDAMSQIGATRFVDILNRSVFKGTGWEGASLEPFLEHLHRNRTGIARQLQQRAPAIRRRWKRYERAFFEQTQTVTGVAWRRRRYRAILIYSCFWGGDYDSEGNVYVSPSVRYGDPLYVVYHEMSHLLYWEFVRSISSEAFIRRAFTPLWQLSEIMVNYPLLKLRIGFRFPLILPPDLPGRKTILAQFPTRSYREIIQSEVARIRVRARRAQALRSR